MRLETQAKSNRSDHFQLSQVTMEMEGIETMVIQKVNLIEFSDELDVESG